MNFVERVAQAGNPLNPEQLKVLLAGCDVVVTPSEAERLFSHYCHATDNERRPSYALRS